MKSTDGKKAKRAMRPNISDIDKKSLLLVVENMHRSLRNYDIENYESADFKAKNLKIFKGEPVWFEDECTFKALSLISVMLIDLGIIFE